jgi:hypothetical protein
MQKIQRVEKERFDKGRVLLPVGNIPTSPLYNPLKGNISRLSPKRDGHQEKFEVLKYRQSMWVFDCRWSDAGASGISV